VIDASDTISEEDKREIHEWIDQNYA
jgi:hypothetical protein